MVHCGAEGLIANIEAEFPYQFIIPIDQTYPVCRFFDQFAGVGYRRQSFYFHIPRMQSSSLTFDEYMNISLSNSRCFRSDDLMISNFFALAGVPGIGLNHLINPRTIRPLQYSMGSDALHKLEPSGHPYFRCTMYLYELGLRSLVIKPPFEPNDHLINDFQGIWEYGNKAVIILPQDYKTNYIRHFDTATTNNATIHHPPFNYSLIRNLYQHAINQPLSVYSDNKSSGHYSTDRLEDLAYVHTMVQFVNPDKKILNVYYDGAVFCRLRKGQIKPSGSGSGSVAANNSNDIEIYVYLNEKKHLISSKSISKYLLKHGLKQENIVYVSRNVDVDIIPTGAPV